MFVEKLKVLKESADQHAGQFTSEGFITFFAMLDQELSDEYFASIEDHLKTLKRDGVLISAELGKGNKGTNYALCPPHNEPQNWIQQIFTEQPPTYTFRINDRE